MKKASDKAPSPRKSSESDLDIVAALAKIAGEYELAEVEIERGGLKVRVARFAAGQALPATPPQTIQPAPAPAVPAGRNVPPPAPEPQAAIAEQPGTVKSPMVGTAYLRPSPESKPFVEVGSVVKQGDKILLVEAMKTFNEILATHSGTVTSILVEDGTPVEYDQPLM
ncbi:MAG TPA: acetyl-CoA carboxylase biotin carboxyl carrier protein, partial [Roseiarcus sp.]|nr:acetyl-CoA carboxylase biotin carboxyl carrier protein [Roseiarcus sp.]